MKPTCRRGCCRCRELDATLRTGLPARKALPLPATKLELHRSDCRTGFWVALAGHVCVIMLAAIVTLLYLAAASAKHGQCVRSAVEVNDSLRCFLLS